jgi:hypothetical protein
MLKADILYVETNKYWNINSPNIYFSKNFTNANVGDFLLKQSLLPNLDEKILR